MEIEVEFDSSCLKKIKKIEKAYGQKNIRRAQKDAVNKGKTELSKEIRNKYNVKKSDIENFIDKKQGQIDVESRPLTIGSTTHFSITPKQYSSQKGISVKRRKKASATILKKGKKKLKHAFIANPGAVSNTMLWRRTDKDTIEPIKTLSAAQTASNKEVSKVAIETMMETFGRRLQHYAELEMEKLEQ